MSQQPSGLRFDIYERVHLPDGVAGIQELDEVELVPEIRVTPAGEQALLKGHLILRGTYASGSGETRSTETLRHLIPVEITLPMDRVSNMDSISVEIENFDIDLLSARSLNVTGVLSLNGIETAAASAQEWQEEETEEIVFVHDSAAPAEPAKASAAIEPVELVERQEAPAEPAQRSEPPRVEPAAQAEEAEKPKEPKEPKAADNEALAEPAAEAGPEKEKHGEGLDFELEEDEEEDAPPAMMADSAGEIGEAADDKKEMKIAFGSKSAAPPSGNESFPWQKWLHRRTAESPDSAAESGRSGGSRFDKAAQTAQAELPSEEIEWKRLFLSGRSESKQFRRVRMCIVQKDETLETIAARYELKPQELQLFNKLGMQELAEGQILYIPGG